MVPLWNLYRRSNDPNIGFVWREFFVQNEIISTKFNIKKQKQLVGNWDTAKDKNWIVVLDFKSLRCKFKKYKSYDICREFWIP